MINNDITTAESYTNLHFFFFFFQKNLINFVIIIISRFACMDPASLTIVPDIKLPTVDGRQLSPENCVSSNKEVNKN